MEISAEPKTTRTSFYLVFYITEQELAVRINFKGYKFIAPDTNLTLVVHHTICRDVDSKRISVSPNFWVVSEPRTGRRLIHERNFTTRHEAITDALEALSNRGMESTMEAVMLNIPRALDAPIHILQDGVLVPA